MAENSIHNPDRYMVDLRQILSQGKKRIGVLIGAGAPFAVKLNANGEIDENGEPLIPDVARLTTQVLDKLNPSEMGVIELLKLELGENPNIETILTRIRRLSEALGSAKVYELDGAGYKGLATVICKKIGEIVSVELPHISSPYTEFVSWVGGTSRENAIEIFTPNYDLLLEEAFERAKLPYFDGFTGSHRPFFDSVSITDDKIPNRWSRLWKIHGSLGWEISGDTVVRTGTREATNLIYPDHLKYDEITRQPYSALFSRLSDFLKTPDSILICTGFSFFDAHITNVIDESLSANNHTAVLAFQYSNLSTESAAVKIAFRRPNLSLYGRDGAVIHGVRGKWRPGKPPTDEWENIRKTFWKNATPDSDGEFLLGDFAKLARFFALSKASELSSILEPEIDDTKHELLQKTVPPEAPNA